MTSETQKSQAQLEVEAIIASEEADKEAFEKFASRHMNRPIGDCFLRDCNDIEPDRTYQNFDTEAAWLDWQSSPHQSNHKTGD